MTKSLSDEVTVLSAIQYATCDERAELMRYLDRKDWCEAGRYLHFLINRTNNQLWGGRVLWTV